MSFRVICVCVYSRFHSARRDITFNRQGLSIVTGVSRRGKSAIQAILDYLLASRGCAIPRGVVRDAVSHVGGLFERHDGVRMVVVRAVPREGHAGSQEIHVQTGFGLALPDAPTDGRWNLDSAKERISEFAGIEALPLLRTQQGDDEDKYSAANIRHTAPFLFQPQDVIASRVVSFPGLEDFWYKRHVLDALDYLLGVFNRELLSVRRELRQLEGDERTAKRKLAEMRRLGADGYERGQRLLAEAVATGLAPDGRADSILDVRRLLAAALKSEDATAEGLTASAVPVEAIEAERSARAEYYAIQHEIGRVEAEAQAAGAHKAVVTSGIERIGLRNLLPVREPGDCPLCGSSELASDDLAAALDAAADALGREQSIPERLHSETEKRLAALREREAASRSRMRAAQRSLRALFEYLSENRSVVDELRRRERLRGRIESYLAAIADTDDAEADVTKALVERIEQLRRRLSGRDGERRAAQQQVEDAATGVASKLDVEFDEPTRVDLGNLALQVKAGSKWVRLEEFGSGANWVSYHVAGALGLAQVFAARSAPVPRFLVLDQPSQAWFPPDLAEAGVGLPTKSEDRRAVERLYQVLTTEARREGAPQVIVLDHAKIAEDWFEEQVVEDWHDPGEALVPSDWNS